MQVRHDPQVGCANCDRIGEEGDPPYYQVPFIYGPGRLCMEWQCSDCVEQDPAFTIEDEKLLLGDVEVEEVGRRYSNGEAPDEILKWPIL
jgi:hypothetical protein